MCIYGFCIQRNLHMIHQMIITHPTTIIYLIKLDMGAVYRCLRVTPNHAVMVMTIVDEMAHLEAQLPFGTKAGPSVYIMADMT